MKRLETFIIQAVWYFLPLISNVQSQEQQPELVLQNDHSHYITSLAFTPDGKTCISQDQNDAVKLWDMETGRLFGTFEENSLFYDLPGHYL